MLTHRDRSSRSRATWGRSRSAALEGAGPLQRVGAPLWLRGADGRGPAERGNGTGAEAERILGLLDGQPADRPGRARDPDPDGERVRGDRQRRHPAPAAHRGRGERPTGQAAARGAASSRRATPAQVRQMLRGVLAPGGTASEVSVPGYQLAGKTGTASKVNPATGRILGNGLRGLVHRLRAGVRPEAAVRGDRRRTADGLDLRRHRRRPAFGQIMAFALPYLGIPPG